MNAPDLPTHQQDSNASTHRGRLFEGMARAVAAQGFAACTIADIVREAAVSYLRVLADNPIMLRALFIDILSLGTEGLAARRRVNHEIAEFLLSVVNPERDYTVMSPAMAMAVVGGINELVLELIEQDRIQDIHTITDTTSTLIRAVVGATPQG